MIKEPLYPPEITERLHGLQKELDNSNTPFSKKIILLVATLQCYNFEIIFARDGITYENKGPYILIESPLAKKIKKTGFKFPPGSKERSTTFDNLDTINLPMQAKLLKLLKEFYQGRSTPFFNRLTVQSKAGHTSYLSSQASEIMVLPEYNSQRKKWLQESLDEMNAFAEFLITKLPK